MNDQKIPVLIEFKEREKIPLYLNLILGEVLEELKEKLSSLVEFLQRRKLLDISNVKLFLK